MEGWEKHVMEQMSQRLSLLEGSAEETNEGIEDIKRELTGSKLDPLKKGALSRLNDHETRIEKLEKRWDKWVYILTGFSIGTGYAIYDILRNLFTALTKH